MSSQSASSRITDGIRGLPGRTPLRVKLVAALLALVAIALVVISAASVSLFRDYQIRHASIQVSDLFQQVQQSLSQPHSPQPGAVDPLGPYMVIIRPASGRLDVPPGVTSLPKVPTQASWLSANADRAVNVPAQSGPDNWRVITQQVTYTYFTIVNGQPGQQRVTATLIVGVDLGDINAAIGQLVYIDVIVSLIIMAALAIVGVAAVRAGLRPLTDIERTAQAIAAGDLSQRVPDRDPRTEVGRLGRSLNAMLAQIETAFHARAQSEVAARRSEERMRRFIADASHELRTPLTAIRGYAEYYRQRGGVANGGGSGSGRAGSGGTSSSGTNGGGTGSSGTNGGGTNGSTAGRDAAPREPAAAEAALGDVGAISGTDMNRIMERVEQESARMGVLVEDLLLLARLDQQRPLERRPVDLLSLAADAVQDARMIAPDRAIDLTVDSGTAFLVLGDEVRLRQVIGNLMSNALTHTPDRTPVHIRLRSEALGPGPAAPGGQQPAGQQPGGREPGEQAAVTLPAAVLEVADEGPGLPPEQAERVFERFYRADQARTRQRGGTGLGLAIVAALVAAHGGTVAVDTAPGRGASFRITLPLAPETQES
jgi:two-component system OmpR family sensor kinase